MSEIENVRMMFYMSLPSPFAKLPFKPEFFFMMFYAFLRIRDGKRAPGGQWARNKRTARACPGKTVIYVFSGEAVPVSTFLGNCPELPIFIKKNLVRIFSELFFFFFRKKHWPNKVYEWFLFKKMHEYIVFYILNIIKLKKSHLLIWSHKNFI